MTKFKIAAVNPDTTIPETNNGIVQSAKLEDGIGPYFARPASWFTCQIPTPSPSETATITIFLALKPDCPTSFIPAAAIIPNITIDAPPRTG